MRKRSQATRRFSSRAGVAPVSTSIISGHSLSRIDARPRVAALRLHKKRTGSLRPEAGRPADSILHRPHGWLELTRPRPSNRRKRSRWAGSTSMLATHPCAAWGRSARDRGDSSDGNSGRRPKKAARCDHVRRVEKTENLKRTPRQNGTAVRVECGADSSRRSWRIGSVIPSAPLRDRLDQSLGHRLATAQDQSSAIQRQRAVSGIVTIVPVILGILASLRN